MGTFIIRPTILASGGASLVDIGSIPANYAGWFILNPSTILDAMLDLDGSVNTLFGFLADADTVPSALTDTLRFNFTGLSIYLDGSPTPVSFASLPSGITPLSASINITINNHDANAHYYLQQGAGVNGSIDTNIFPYDFSSIKPSMLDIVNNGCGLKCSASSDPPNGGPNWQNEVVYIYDLFVSGTYIIQSSQFTLENPTVPVRIGDKVKITSPTGGLDKVVQIQLSYTDPVTGIPKLITINTGIDGTVPSLDINGVIYLNLYWIIFQTPSLFWFYIPWGFGTFSGLVTITLVGNGTQFSGSVVLGALQILFEDASGIYSLVKDQTNDILYFRDGYVTDVQSIIAPNISYEEETFEGDLFNLLPYPYKILAQDNFDEDYILEDFSIISTLRIPIVLKNVEIPSPFVRTAFLP